MLLAVSVLQSTILKSKGAEEQGVRLNFGSPETKLTFAKTKSLVAVAVLLVYTPFSFLLPASRPPTQLSSMPLKTIVLFMLVLLVLYREKHENSFAKRH
mmetsp:Transcript_7219/g.5481  ORF Transcript_7219/g.5481 Transcript_7219/m.5481 type:complete len:99 (+) Transcript_7219:295-591(+)